MDRQRGADAVAATMARPWSVAAQVIVNAHSASSGDGMPVYQRLKKCIADLIVAKALPEGAQLPPEQWLARNLGVSLGTAQKALNALTADGYVERRQGHGTYVATPRSAMTELWHFRFFDSETGTFAPVYSHLVRRRIVGAARAEAVLGADPKGFVEIERAIDVNGEFSCHSRMYLGASHFSELMTIDQSVFENVNLKLIFAGRFGRPTLEAIQHIHLAKPSAAANAVLGLKRGELSIVLTVIAISHSGPYSLQEIHIPQSRFGLDVSISNRGKEVASRLGTAAVKR